MKRINLLNVGRVLLLLTAFVMLFIVVDSLNAPEKVVAQSEDNPEQQQIDTTSNLYCLNCHAEAYNPVQLPSGESLYIQVEVADFANSTHDRNQITCVQCHKDISGFPHPIKTAQTLHEYQLQRDTACVECHEVQANQTKDSIHGLLLNQGDPTAPTCSNCHDPHTQAYMEELTKTERSEICANCHSGIYQEYSKSVHGER